jgi:hypothetical protein
MDMKSFVVGIGVALVPFGAVLALLWLSAWIERRREMAVARQIELTDAIHQELGAVAAPTVQPARHGSWRVVMAVPVDRPETLGALVRITDRVISRAERARGRRVEIAVTPLPDREAA